MLPVAVYARISNDPHGLRAGVVRQLADTRAIASMRYPDAPVVEYVDNDESAYKGQVRPAFQAMCQAMMEGRIRAIIPYNFDRFIRLPRELETFLDQAAAVGFADMVTAEGDIDLSTHDGQLHARILAAMAKKSSDDTSRRTKRVLRDLAERGIWSSGHTPYGYLREREAPGGLVPDPVAAPIVSAAVERVVGGGSVHALVHGPDGPSTYRGWSGLLASPTNAGFTRLMTPAQWPAIVAVDRWRAVLGVLQDPRRFSGGSRERQHWLSGLMRCGLCDGSMRMHRNGKYICTGCHRIVVSKLRVESHVEGALFDAVKQVVTRAPIVVQRRGVKGGGTPPSLEQLAADYGDGLMTRAEWIAARERVLDALAVDVSPVPPARLVSADLEQLWSDMDASSRHRAASDLLLRVTVHPSKGHGWDDSRVEFHWRR